MSRGREGHLQKHKKGKRITKNEVIEVLGLLGRGRSKTAVARETGVSRSKVSRLWSETLARDADEQAIQQREEEDRKKPCLQHVFIREIVREDFPFKPKGALGAQKITHIDCCRLCGFEKRRPPRFLQMDWESDLPGKTGAETPAVSESSSAE